MQSDIQGHALDLAVDTWRLHKGMAYGDMMDAKLFGSGGGGAKGGSGGGRLEFYSPHMIVDGLIAADSYDSYFLRGKTPNHLQIPVWQHPEISTMNTRGIGGGYSPVLKEFWYPQWAGSTIYRYNDEHAYVGSFVIGQSSVKQIWPDVDDMYYIVTGSTYGQIKKLGPFPQDTVEWTSKSYRFGGISVDDTYVYAVESGYPEGCSRCNDGQELMYFDKLTGVQSKASMPLIGGRPSFGAMQGSLVVFEGKIYHGYSNRFYRYNLTTGHYDGVFWETHTTIQNMAFTGQDICVGDGGTRTRCYRVVDLNVWDEFGVKDGAGGGSGGSIHIDVDAMEGGVTGELSVQGGSGDFRRAVQGSGCGRQAGCGHIQHSHGRG